ncbi:hypothetical protein ACTFIV_009460 [Dictyostelium citrinum]
MKINIVPFFIIIVLFYNNVNGDCPNCLKENEICDDGIYRGSCSYDTTCFYNSSLPTYQIRKCTKYLREGDECSLIDDLCIRGTDCLLDKNNDYRCLDNSFASAGEECELDSDCITKELVCINGICQIKPLKDCEHDSDNCNYNEYCSCGDGSECMCKIKKDEGGVCTFDSHCSYGLTCENGVCTSYQFIGLGFSCTSSSYKICDYNKGLYCSNNICQKFVEPSPSSCNPNATTTQCSSYQTCSCSDNKCYQSEEYPPDGKILSEELMKCAFDNECSTSVNIYSSESCLSKNCRKEICNYYKGYYRTEEIDDCGKESLRVDLLCNSSFKINSQSLTTLFFILLFVFAITF